MRKRRITNIFCLRSYIKSVPFFCACCSTKFEIITMDEFMMGGRESGRGFSLSYSLFTSRTTHTPHIIVTRAFYNSWCNTRNLNNDKEWFKLVLIVLLFYCLLCLSTKKYAGDIEIFDQSFQYCVAFNSIPSLCV